MAENVPILNQQVPRPKFFELSETTNENGGKKLIFDQIQSVDQELHAENVQLDEEIAHEREQRHIFTTQAKKLIANLKKELQEKQSAIQTLEAINTNETEAEERFQQMHERHCLKIEQLNQRLRTMKHTNGFVATSPPKPPK